MADLPGDLWALVSDFLPAPAALSLVCWPVRRAVYGRRVACRVTPDTVFRSEAGLAQGWGGSPLLVPSSSLAGENGDPYHKKKRLMW